MAAVAASGPPPTVVQFFKLCADETRLTLLRLLMRSDLRVGEIVERLELPLNLVSYHLKQLRSLGLMRDRRSSSDARDIYYSLDLERLHALYLAAGDALHPGITCGDDRSPNVQYLDRPLRVLFLCTHNSARSQLAEGILRFLGGDKVEAYSAGSYPTQVHPETLDLLWEWGIDTSELRSKPLSRFLDQTFDYILTVCDRVREECPLFPGDPIQMHWSIPDPLAIEDWEERHKAFCAIRQELRTRIQYLLLVPEPATHRRIRWPRGVGYPDQIA
jgi:ArsR family transcriptional regulator, arsenate/arsenite/antimonite-responsive transcriptional repressor / arsenate reductase (thioredoxin)